MGVPVHSRRHQATFVVLTLAVVAYALLQSLVIPVLGAIGAGLHASRSDTTWVLTVYLLAAAICTPIVGRLGDMFGKGRLLVVALATVAAGTALSALAGSIDVMLVGRAVQGAGGGVIPLAFGIIRDEFPAERVPGAVGLVAALTSAGAGFGIVVAGPIVDVLGYRWLFWIPTIMLAVAGVAAKVVVPESPVRAPGRVNWAAAVLLSGWLVALLLAISEAPSWGWRSAHLLGALLLAVVLAAGWVAVETRSGHPLVDMAMMRIPVVWTTNLVALLLGLGMYATFAFVPQFLQTPTSAGYGFGVSITTSGLIMLPSSAAMFLIGLTSGYLSERLGAKAMLVAGSALSVVTFVLLTLALAHEWEAILATTLQGVGFGLAFVAMSNLIVAGVPEEQTGVASGMNANIRTIGGAMGAAVMGSVVAATAAQGRLPAKAGYSHGFALLAGATVLATLAATRVPSTARRLRPGRRTTSTPYPELGRVTAGALVEESE